MVEERLDDKSDDESDRFFDSKDHLPNII